MSREDGRPDRPTLYAALGASISIDEYAGGPGLGGASLLAHNQDDTVLSGADATSPPCIPTCGSTCWPWTAASPRRSWSTDPAVGTVGRRARRRDAHRRRQTTCS